MEIWLKFFMLFGIPAILYLGRTYWIRFTEKNKLRRYEEMPIPEHYQDMLKRFTPYQFLSAEEKKRFQGRFLYFLEDKFFNGVGDLVVTEEMKVFIASEACLMITNIPGGVYPGLKNIYIMEDVFIPKDNPVNALTGLPTHSARLGEAWKQGPIVLSWKSITQGSSVIFHEFSHQLDQQDGSFDGTPHLEGEGNYSRWAQVMGKDYLKLRNDVLKHKKTDIDSYGATNEAEFFAVISEYFFTNPNHLKEKHPEMYGELQNYFKLDPSLWQK